MDESFARGKEVLKEVVGPHFRSNEKIDEDLLELIVKYAFGEIWSRPGLELDTRRLITLAMTLAGGNFDEFKLHLRFALANGVDRSTIKEVLLHSAIYCGIPMCLRAFRSANEVYAEIDAEAVGHRPPA